MLKKYKKYLVDISSELFLFNYITKQFEKETLLQIPRIIFFPTLYNDKFENIFTIREEEINLKCSLLSFVGTLEIDGAFKYVGENMELNCKSLVVIFTENLNNKKNLEKYMSNKEKKEIIYKWINIMDK